MRCQPVILLVLGVVLCGTVAAARDAVPQIEVPVAWHGPPITFGPPGCPVVLAGNRVWHLGRNAQVQTLNLEEELSGSEPRALSGNGQWFAYGHTSYRPDRKAIQVWNCVTGEKQCEIPLDPEFQFDYLDVLLNKYVVACTDIAGDDARQLQVWSIADGKSVKTLDTLLRGITKGSVAFTSDAKFYAMAAGIYGAKSEGHVVVFNTTEGKPALTMTNPDLKSSGRAIVVRDNQVIRGARAREIVDSTIIKNTKAIAFSPDDRELAAIYSWRGPRLIVWNRRGEIQLDEPLKLGPVLPPNTSFQWLPDRSGWWIGKQLYDRKTKRFVFQIAEPKGFEWIVHPVSRDYVFTILKSSIVEPHTVLGKRIPRSAKLATVQLPWDKARAPSAKLPIVLE